MVEEGLEILQEAEGQIIFCEIATYIEMNREATHNVSKIWLPKQDPSKDNSSDIFYHRREKSRAVLPMGLPYFLLPYQNWS